MNSFEKTGFRGSFRSYQQNILDNAQKHLKDGRIHIVAAPGSGKTTLGLELIRRLGRPALVLSPSVTIRQQWGERFEGSFLPETESPENYLSYSLKKPSLITSITYQALHAAFTKTELEDESDDDEESAAFKNENTDSFSGFDLIGEFKRAGIQTVCLDEAHHLRSEWQKALEGFIAAVSGNITLIALTATPPYDSTPAEWERYSALCGEIDEEIFVPQLVAQKTLCPHQDYVYFSYPTADETAMLSEYRKKAFEAVNAVISDGIVAAAVNTSGVLRPNVETEELIIENDEQFSALLSLAARGGMNIPQNIAELASPKNPLPAPTLKTAQTAFEFILENPELFTENIADSLKSELSQRGLIEKRKVCLCANDKITKALVSSTGKLDGIGAIVRSEYASLGGGLRMLILTDFIKRDLMKIIGTGEPVTAMGTVPVFEAVRRCQTGAKLAVLSGGLVIVPTAESDGIAAIAAQKQIAATMKPIGQTDYSEAVFSGSNKNKVAVITEAFQQGRINILIGTKSLLGEGWDSPCINSLILASFVGSFMLSNQMRGRAIRMDKDNPAKASNIWHLVTINPEISESGEIEEANASEEIRSDDYDTVKRRFECFLAPSYSGNVIQSGIERVGILKPPFNRTGFEAINTQMLALAANRTTMAQKWAGVVKNASRTEILDVTELPKTAKPKTKFRIARDIVIKIILILIACGLYAALTFSRVTSDATPNPIRLIIAVSYIAVAYFCVKACSAVIQSEMPVSKIKPVVNAIFKALKEAGAIDGKNARVNIEDRDSSFCCSLSNAAEHDKNVFSSALSEFFSPIDNPRYIVFEATGSLSDKKPSYKNSFACPSVIGQKKENAAALAKHLGNGKGKFDIVYTRTVEGRIFLIKCKRASRTNSAKKSVLRKKEVG